MTGTTTPQMRTTNNHQPTETMIIKIDTESLKDAGRLLNRLKFARHKLPVLTHILADPDPGGLTLAVSNHHQWLETRVPLAAAPAGACRSLLIPPAAFRAALKADRGSVVTLVPGGGSTNPFLKLVAIRGGMAVETRHPTLDPAGYPPGPEVEGDSAILPGRTFEMLALVAPCASRDHGRAVLNGVCLTPEDGGRVVATDGRRLAAAPATVHPAGPFILPAPAVHVLAHPDFARHRSTVTLSREEGGNRQDRENTEDRGNQNGKPGCRFACLQTGNHTLITRLTDGHYPNWKQVVPDTMVASATIAAERRPALIAWLRSLGGADGSVILRRRKRGLLQLTSGNGNGNGNGGATHAAATVEVPADLTGSAPPVALNPFFLADALEIAPTLWLADSASPVVARRPDGVLCVVMPMRLPPQTDRPEKTSGTPAAA